MLPRPAPPAAHRLRLFTPRLELSCLPALWPEPEGRGLVEAFTDDEGKPALRLKPKGAQMGRALAMAGDDADPDAVLEALLGDRGDMDGGTAP